MRHQCFSWSSLISPSMEYDARNSRSGSHIPLNPRFKFVCLAALDERYWIKTPGLSTINFDTDLSRQS